MNEPIQVRPGVDSRATHTTGETDPSAPARWERRLARWTPLLLVAFGSFLAWLVWDAGADPVVDFGRELYVPWRLVEGEKLHVDIAWFNGPLSPWVNAAWFRIAGVSFDALQALNLAVLLGAALALRTLLRGFTDELAAASCAFAFLAVFGFFQYARIGNYSYLAPYSHGLTHGFAASAFALVALARLGPRGGWALAAGAALGAAFLTKAEIFLAGGGAGLVGLVAGLTRPGLANRRLWNLAAFVAGFGVVVGAAFGRLSADLGARDAFQAVLGSWVYVFDERVSHMPFYSAMRGTDDVAANLVIIAKTAAGLSTLVGVVYFVIARIDRRGPPQGTGLLLAGGIGAVATAAALVPAHLAIVARPVQALSLCVALVAAMQVMRAPRGSEARARAALRLVFAVFAGLLLAKIALRPMIRFYGFVLAAPAVLLGLGLLVHGLPALCARSGRSPARMRAAALGMVATFCAAHMNAGLNWNARRTVELGTEPDRLLVPAWRGTPMAAALEDLTARVGPDQTLLVMPEGVTLNYLTRRRSPLSVINFMPPELIFFGEERILTELEAEPPDVIVLVHKSTEEYGYRFFGQGYGREIFAWLRANYRMEKRFGAPPLVGGDFGVAIYMPRAE